MAADERRVRMVRALSECSARSVTRPYVGAITMIAIDSAHPTRRCISTSTIPLLTAPDALKHASHPLVSLHFVSVREADVRAFSHSGAWCQHCSRLLLSSLRSRFSCAQSAQTFIFPAIFSVFHLWLISVTATVSILL